MPVVTGFNDCRLVSSIFVCVFVKLILCFFKFYALDAIIC